MASTVFYIASLTTTCAAAALWFISASRPLTSIKPGLEGLDRVTQLSNDLQTMSMWNMWAALATGFSVAFQILENVMLLQGR
jgi:hypothetical protein